MADQLGSRLITEDARLRAAAPALTQSLAEALPPAAKTPGLSCWRSMNMSSFFAELKRRNVYKVAIGSALISCLATPGAATVASTQSPVPIEKEPRHRLKFENKSVRVFDVLIPSGDASLFHTHVHDGLSVRITDAQIRDEPVQGDSEESTVKRGAVTFSYRPKPMTHRVSNIGKTPFRNIFIEILPSSDGSTRAPLPPSRDGYAMVLENERVRVSRLVPSSRDSQLTGARPRSGECG